MLVAVAVNAAETTLEPGSDVLRQAVKSASAGDVLILTDGVYQEPEVVELNKSLTIQAAEGASPIVAQHYYMKLLNSAQVTFIGIKFDGGLYNEGAGANDHFIRPYDNSENKTLTLIGCEICNWKSYVIYPQRADRCMKELVIRKCFFHDNARSAIYVETGSSSPLPLAELAIEHSTFAGTGSSNRAIDVKNGGSAVADAKIRIDHCTFYNYGPVRSEQSTDVVISNSIFAFPTEGATATNLYAGAAINNCLVFNMTHASGPTVTGEIAADPKFKDAANNDFTLDASSPAIAAGADNSNLGDARWWPAAEPVEPLMKTIYCKMDKAWWKADGAAVGVYTWDDGGNAKAAWPGERMTPVEGEADLWSVELDINTYHMCIFTRVNGEGNVADWGAKTGDLTIPTDEKDLYTITSESAVWGDPGVAGEWSKYEPSAPVVLDAPDAAPAEPTLQGYQVKAVYSAKYSADFNFGEWGSGTQYKQEEFGKKYATTNLGYFGMEFTGMDCSEMEALHLDAWIAADASIRVVPIHGGTEVGVTVELKGQQWNSIDIALSKFEGVTNWSNVYQIKIDNAANLTFWLNNVYFYTTQTKTIDLVDGYYLIGTMNSWDIHNLTAADKFAVNLENDKEYVLTTALAENDEFKVVAVANNALGAWYPGEGENYKVDFAHAGDSKDIYFRPDYQGGEGWHAGCIYVAENVNTNPYETWFATGDTWNAETESYLEWNEDAKKATVYIKVDKYDQWRAQVKYHGPIAEAGKYYRVALKMKSNNALQNVTVKYQDNAEMIYVADAALEAGVEFVFDKKAAGVAGGNGIMVLDFGFAKAGDIIEIYDVVIEETEAPEPTLVDGFYLIGRINGVDGWDVAALKAENKFSPNLENPSEFMLNVTLAENDEIQVVNVLNDVITAWYPGGESNNYVVDANHAGAKTIYFRPDNQGGEDWWHGCIYVAPNHGTGLENTNAAVKAVKVIENGQLYIILNGVRYNALGQME